MAGYSIDILNNIRLNASTEYKERIPAATQANISSIGQAFQTYTPLYNEFCDALINKIGRTIIINKMFKNPLGRFKSGLVSPHDIEEIFVEMAKAEGAYDPTGPNPLGRREGPDVEVVYHRQNRQDYYAISIGELDFLRVFRSESTLDTFIKAKINAVYSGDEWDEYLAMKNVIATYPALSGGGLGYFDYAVGAFTPSDKETFCKTFVKTLRKAVRDLSFMSNKYNAAGVMTRSNPSEMVLLVHKDITAEVDVELLAHAFHQSNTDMKVVPVIIDMDDFGSMTDCYGVLVDKDWFRIFDTYMAMKKQNPNEQGLFTNYFFHHHQILSASPFRNAVRLMATNPGANDPE